MSSSTNIEELKIPEAWREGMSLLIIRNTDGPVKLDLDAPDLHRFIIVGQCRIGGVCGGRIVVEDLVVEEKEGLIPDRWCEFEKIDYSWIAAYMLICQLLSPDCELPLGPSDTTTPNLVSR